AECCHPRLGDAGRVLVLFGVGFFFSSRRRHTSCYRDWSSDVCSSDLKNDHKVKLFEIACADGNYFKVREANGVGSGVPVPVLDLNVLFADADMVLLGFGQCVAQVQEKALAGHLEDAETRASGGKLELAVDFAATMDDFVA